jgi:copper chaperone CopZ
MKAIKALSVLIVAIILSSVSLNSFGQIESVTLQASGLTCSMCSRAIYKSLQKVPDVGKVEEDIEHSSYHIRFTHPGTTSLAALRKAVTDAGFSVARMEITVDFQHAAIDNNSTLKFNDQMFQFVDISNQVLDGQRKLLIVDKDYLLEKDRKKYTGSYSMDPNILHVTIPQS